ncbi:hypothetical protein A2634_04765 [Candidatus Amesbacteria bacterium RIFCSPHIGHO2_01_FULL_48_32]|uniref:Glycosyl transferase family 1 domain-containing protein n=1 Tax=Candidatus Amesbacteria bacterium RIFCSPLOWO2_01_FULL_48_25 TaxID=1797259 RepID=A0A1F4ZB86_9BACT|nr:MAG: hypothetical protein A2634_04765 [Candidatus Amesbacteria bacterium RIFCSPHIGHO2_01_FULL_48_32]OGD03451.1 MAG: hypothetical protein A2989_02375 [Candidatus Amesbacteria bacterium RIFCSPLOWO2_01_FULL_48_25]HJZ05756.1 glycosyltransferase family 4 protein [Patescibacteria group bacterium]
MRILFYSPVDLLHGGGCERWHCDITNSLVKQYGHEVEIVTGNLGEKRWNENYLSTQLSDISYTRIQYPTLFGAILPTFSAFSILLKKFRNADIVHFICGFIGQDLLVAVLKFITQKKVVVGHHAPIFHSSRLHNLYMQHVSRYVFRYFDAHQTLNSSDREFLETRWGIKNVYFIPSGVRTEKFLRSKRKNHSGLMFISVGRYAWQKGIDLQLRAIEMFNRRMVKNSAQFNFVGSGELGKIIDDYTKRHKNIINLRYMKYEVMPKLYAQNDIFFLCSREEPFGLVLVEAWASGLPVLATRTAGPIDMLVNGKNGWFIPQITSKSISDALYKIYLKHTRDANFTYKMRERCRETGRIFSIDTTARKMHQTFFAFTA